MKPFGTRELVARRMFACSTIVIGVAALRQTQPGDRESTFTIPADAEPQAMTLDPGVWRLADPGSFSAAR